MAKTLSAGWKKRSPSDMRPTEIPVVKLGSAQKGEKPPQKRARVKKAGGSDPLPG